METSTTHKISWFAYAGTGLIPCNAQMRGTWSYEAKCSCGWETNTGGAVKSYITREVRFHKDYPDWD
jgi:hypothetical protein